MVVTSYAKSQTQNVTWTEVSIAFTAAAQTSNLATPNTSPMLITALDNFVAELSHQTQSIFPEEKHIDSLLLHSEIIARLESADGVEEAMMVVHAILFGFSGALFGIDTEVVSFSMRIKALWLVMGSLGVLNR